MSKNTSKALTTTQVAYTIGVHPITVLHWIYARKLKARKANGRWRIRQEDLDAFLASRANSSRG